MIGLFLYDNFDLVPLSSFYSIHFYKFNNGLFLANSIGNREEYHFDEFLVEHFASLTIDQSINKNNEVNLFFSLIRLLFHFFILLFILEFKTLVGFNMILNIILSIKCVKSYKRRSQLSETLVNSDNFVSHFYSCNVLFHVIKGYIQPSKFSFPILGFNSKVNSQFYLQLRF